MHKKGPRERRDFWNAWGEEHHRLWEEAGETSGPSRFSPAHFSRPRFGSQWRMFFHSFMGAWPEKHWAIGGRRFNPWRQGVDAFNPFVAALLSKGGGLLPLVVLNLLSQGPRYGNELMDLISEDTSGGWVANPGAIYPLMTVLEKHGLAIGHWSDPRKRTVRIYEITPAGEQELDRLKAIIHPKLDEAIDVLQKLAADLNGEASGYRGDEDKEMFV